MSFTLIEGTAPAAAAVDAAENLPLVGGGGGGNFIFEKEKKVMYIYTIKADSYM